MSESRAMTWSVAYLRMAYRALIFVTFAAAISTGAQAAEINEDGLHVQPWFLDSFLVLSEDLAESAGDGKRLAVIFEQRACPYCREMHTVNFADADLTDYIKKHFNVVQLNLWGSRTVTDLDGKELEERDLAKRWRVNFTPTIVFLPESVAEAAVNSEVARMPGYFKPFHFRSMFEYVQMKAYKERPFQRFLQEKFQKLEREGKKATVW